MGRKANIAARWTVGAAALGFLVAGGEARAATTCGTIITNIATVTMWSGPLDQIGYTLSYNVTATVRVVCPVTSLVKYADRGVASAGSTVTFFICVDNQRMTADGSVWNVTITDRMPAGMSFVAWSLDDFGGAQVAGFPVWNTALTPTGWTAGAPAVGTTAPLYMRWRVQMVGPMKSACVTFRARIL